MQRTPPPLWRLWRSTQRIRQLRDVLQHVALSDARAACATMNGSPVRPSARSWQQVQWQSPCAPALRISPAYGQTSEQNTTLSAPALCALVCCVQCGITPPHWAALALTVLSRSARRRLNGSTSECGNSAANNMCFHVWISHKKRHDTDAHVRLSHASRLCRCESGGQRDWQALTIVGQANGSQNAGGAFTFRIKTTT